MNLTPEEKNFAEVCLLDFQSHFQQYLNIIKFNKIPTTSDKCILTGILNTCHEKLKLQAGTSIAEKEGISLMYVEKLKSLETIINKINQE